jgi:hypothetical protein
MALASVSVAGRYTWAHKGDEYEKIIYSRGPGDEETTVYASSD